ncbi:MAG TPA: Spy/CpxP family protein refolding chaperone [Gemmatimonadales bacterium]|nr:Spy/CpxP family protein refolding chaperone [Gemmatimonadales bacterium]
MFFDRTLRAITILAVLSTGTAASQDPPRPAEPPQGPAPERPRMGGFMGPMGGPGFAHVRVFQPSRLIDRREVLGLTPDQVARLETLAQEVRQARERADTTSRAQRQRLRDLWNSPTPDPAQIRAAAQAAMQTRQTAALAALEAAAKAKAVLTPEQRGRVAGWADGARMRMRMDRGRPGPAPGMRRMMPMGPRRMRGPVGR